MLSYSCMLQHTAHTLELQLIKWKTKTKVESIVKIILYSDHINIHSDTLLASINIIFTQKQQLFLHLNIWINSFSEKQ